eukprot:gene27283-biopygen17797
MGFGPQKFAQDRQLRFQLDS